MLPRKQPERRLSGLDRCRGEMLRHPLPVCLRRPIGRGTKRQILGAGQSPACRVGTQAFFWCKGALS